MLLNARWIFELSGMRIRTAYLCLGVQKRDVVNWNGREREKETALVGRAVRHARALADFEIAASAIVFV